MEGDTGGLEEGGARLLVLGNRGYSGGTGYCSSYSAELILCQYHAHFGRKHQERIKSAECSAKILEKQITKINQVGF